MFKTKLIIFLLSLLTSPILFAADHYVCIDDDGNTTYAQQPCSPEMTVVDKISLDVYKSPTCTSCGK